MAPAGDKYKRLAIHQLTWSHPLVLMGIRCYFVSGTIILPRAGNVAGTGACGSSSNPDGLHDVGIRRPHGAQPSAPVLHAAEDGRVCLGLSGLNATGLGTSTATVNAVGFDDGRDGYTSAQCLRRHKHVSVLLNKGDF